MDSAEFGRSCSGRSKTPEVPDRGRRNLVCRGPTIQSGTALMPTVDSRYSHIGQQSSGWATVLGQTPDAELDAWPPFPRHRNAAISLSNLHLSSTATIQ